MMLIDVLCLLNNDVVVMKCILLCIGVGLLVGVGLVVWVVERLVMFLFLISGVLVLDVLYDV